MIEAVIQDCKKTSALLIQGENASQKAYEKLVQDYNESITKSRQQVRDWSSEKADQDEKLQQTNEELALQSTEHETKTQTLQAWQADCKFLMLNFDTRQSHMDEEIAALGKAKAFLHGMTEGDVESEHVDTSLKREAALGNPEA